MVSEKGWIRVTECGQGTDTLLNDKKPSLTVVEYELSKCYII